MPTIFCISALRARDGPARVGDESGEREAPKHSARWGMRERGRPGWRCGLTSLAPFDDGLPDDTSGENGGDEGGAGDDS